MQRAFLEANINQCAYGPEVFEKRGISMDNILPRRPGQMILVWSEGFDPEGIQLCQLVAKYTCDQSSDENI